MPKNKPLNEIPTNKNGTKNKPASSNEDRPPKNEDYNVNKSDYEDRLALRLLRKSAANKATYIAWFALSFWVVMFIFQSIWKAIYDKDIFSDTALLTITTGSTVNALGIFTIVVTGLFIDKKSK